MSDALARPHSSGFAPFDIEAEYIWVECDLPRYEGLKVEVRLNLKNKERKRLKIALDEIDAERSRINESQMVRAKDLDARRAAALNAKAPDQLLIADLLNQRIRLIEEVSTLFEVNAERIHELIAPYVRNWNVMDRDEAGNLVDAPPPMVAGVDAFEVLPSNVIGWIAESVINAYKNSKTWPISLPRLGESEQPPTEPSTETPSDAPEESP